jgi:hypothetical protein
MNYIILIFYSIILPILSLEQIKPKLCINCKYFIPDTTHTGTFSKCSFFPHKGGKINFLVNGINNKYDNYYCSTARSTNDMCGEEGKHYKKKIVKNVHIK